MPGQEQSRQIRVLLVEDNEHDRTFFRRSMKRSERAFVITEFVRAEDGIQKLRTDPDGFDLVVTDFMLPGISGLEMCRALLEEDPPWPLVILTGSGSEHVAVEALKAGVYDYIVKDPGQGYLELLPVVLAEVVQKHEDRLARRKAEEEKERLIVELQAALEEVKTLSGFIPICANCKKIRDDEGYWQQIEQYIQERSEAQFSHGICPDCVRELYPELRK